MLRFCCLIIHFQATKIGGEKRTKKFLFLFGTNPNKDYF